MDKKSAFEKFVVEFLEKEVEAIEPALNPIVARLCNGGFPYPFSQAFIHYSPYQDEEVIRGSFDLDAWYDPSYVELCNVLAEEKEIEEDDRPKFECLFDFTTENHQLECLKLLLEDGLTEEKIANIMGLHYFKPLVPKGSYVVDKSYQGASNNTTCKGCKKKVTYDDTSIGNNRVWHGSVDILLKRNIVKVNLEKDIANLNLEKADCEGLEEDSLCNERYTCDDIQKQFTVDEVESMENFKKSCKAQVFAEAIVNAFYISKNESNRNQFVPSFLVTEKHIRVVLYNVEQDILLASSQLPIWEDEENGKLNALTLIRVWLSLNYSDTLEKSDLVQFTKQSKFQDLISDDAYRVYLDKLEQPLKHEKFTQKYESDPNVFDRKVRNDEKRALRGKILQKLVNHAKTT